jgi:hypothetical protein
MVRICVRPAHTVKVPALYWDIKRLHHNRYTTTEDLVRPGAPKRHCEVCEHTFVLGDKVMIAFTTEGSRLLCADCALRIEIAMDPARLADEELGHHAHGKDLL